MASDFTPLELTPRTKAHEIWGPAMPVERPWRVIVCGGRTYTHRASVYALLYDALLGQRTPIDQYNVLPWLQCEFITGAAPGADTLAEAWWHEAGRPGTLYRYPAEWSLFGRGAGPKRNARMLRERQPTLVIAFEGGAGTADMTRRARAAGVPVWQAGACRYPAVYWCNEMKEATDG